MFCVATPVGFLTIQSQNGMLTSTHFTDTPVCGGTGSAVELECARQLKEYFSRKRDSFDLPFILEGSAFQISVWNCLLEIPFGVTRSYSSIAAEIGIPGGARAVGMACRKNKLPVIVPCHRVTGVSGKMTGYAFGVERKGFLLELERREGLLF